MRNIVLTSLVAIAASAFTACGPGYLTPEEVRAHLLLPNGKVAPDTIVRATDELFSAQRASEAEQQALFFKDDALDTAAFAQGALGGSMTDAIATNATPGDVLCAAGLIAALTKFEACRDDQDCEVTLNLDSCVIRAAGDDNASGRIRFHFKNEVEPEFRQASLTLEFEALEFSTGPAAAFFAGVVFVEFTEIGDQHLEVILSTDLDFQLRGFNRGFFNDDIIERVRVTVAVRFTADAGEDFASGTLEILAFVDENGERTESVVLSFAAESREVDTGTIIGGAVLSVRGTNGAFECEWAAASAEHGVEESSYESSGACTDLVSGETFEWSDRFEAGNT